MEGKRILIIGGTGSLGHALSKFYSPHNLLTILSRDECKQWKMRMTFPKTTYILGDIRDYDTVERCIRRAQPHVIIIASALKHIDRCENAVEQCFKTNVFGTANVLNVVEKTDSKCIECVCFISTDKACCPINAYGMCKALSEKLMVERAANSADNIKYVTVRYGNVLNSRGSIIPTLHTIGQDKSKNSFWLTDDRMTRFLMTLEESVALINHAIVSGDSGDIIVPRIRACRIADLITLFSEHYGKDVKVVGIRPGEKLDETLISLSESQNVVYQEDKYVCLRPHYKEHIEEHPWEHYHSGLCTLELEELRLYLDETGMLPS